MVFAWTPVHFFIHLEDTDCSGPSGNLSRVAAKPIKTMILRRLEMPPFSPSGSSADTEMETPLFSLFPSLLSLHTAQEPQLHM